MHPQHLAAEEQYIEKSFRSLHYPRSFILNARRKAHNIHKNSTTPKNKENDTTTRRIVLPTHSISTQIYKNLRNLGIQVALKTSTTIKNIINHTNHKNKKNSPPSQASIYKVPCTQCNLIYIGETARPIKRRLDEHKKALSLDNHNNALVKHRNLLHHNLDLNNAQILKYIHPKNYRKCVESALIACHNTIIQRPGCFQLAAPISLLVLRQHNLLPKKCRERLKT